MLGRVAATPLWTVKARFAEWESVPLVPCAEIVKFPVRAFTAAPKTTEVLEPTATLKGLAGFEVTPEGSALKVTCTLPVNPLTGFTETLRAELVPPCCTETELEERASLKSGTGGGGCVKEDPAPQPAHASANSRSSSIGTQ